MKVTIQRPSQTKPLYQSNQMVIGVLFPLILESELLDICTAIYCSALYLLRSAFCRKMGDTRKEASTVRIAKPLLLVTTPIGLIEGFYECYKLAGGLLFLMVAMVGVMVVAAASVVATIRREERESKEQNACKP